MFFFGHRMPLQKTSRTLGYHGVLPSSAALLSLQCLEVILHVRMVVPISLMIHPASPRRVDHQVTPWRSKGRPFGRDLVVVV